MAWYRNDLAAVADYLRRSDELVGGSFAGPEPVPVVCWDGQAPGGRGRPGPLRWVLLDEAERVYVGDYSPNVQPVHATRARVSAAQGDIT